EVDTRNLKVRKEWDSSNAEEDDITNKFTLINRVTKLKETIALTGFNRLTTNDDEFGRGKIEKGKKLLFKNPDLQENNWLPAYKVYGEGIFFTLNVEKLISWEQRHDVTSYFNGFITRAERNRANIDESIFKPRNVLIHTLAHIII